MDEVRSGDSGDRGGKLTSAREMMGLPTPDPEEEGEDRDRRDFRASGDDWTVRVTGRSRTGRSPDPGAPLMQLFFFKRSDAEKPSRRLLTVDRPLEEFYEEDLQELLERSRPIPEPGKRRRG